LNRNEKDITRFAKHQEEVKSEGTTGRTVAKSIITLTPEGTITLSRLYYSVKKREEREGRRRGQDGG